MLGELSWHIPRKLSHQRLQSCVGCLPGHTRFQAKTDCISEICILREPQRQVDIFAGPTDPARLGNSHYSVVLAVKLQRLSYHVWIRAEMPSPKLITENHHWLWLLPIACVRGLDAATKQR